MITVSLELPRNRAFMVGFQVVSHPSVTFKLHTLAVFVMEMPSNM